MPTPFVPTDEQAEKFLELIAEGKTRQEAAEAVDSTGTRFRALINGKSPESVAFAERYVEALEQAGNSPSPHSARIRELEGVQLAHRILDETILRALDSERGKVGASNRVLYNLALLNVESFKPLLEARTRHIHEGSIGLYAAMPQIDTEKLSIEEQRELVAIDRRRSELIAKAAPDGQKALASGNGSSSEGAKPEQVVDAEFEEVDAVAG